MMKLLVSTKNKINKNENDEYLPHLEIPEIVLAQFDFAKNDYQHDSKALHTFVSKACLVNC